MKKIIIMLFVSLLIPSFAVCADSEDALESKNIHILEQAEALYEKFSIKNAGDYVSGAMNESVVPSLPVFCGIVGMILICAVINTFGINFDGFDIGGYVCTLCFSGYLFNVINSLCESLCNYASSLRNIAVVLIPTLTASSMSDGLSTSTVTHTGLGIAVTVVEYLVTSVVIPCVRLLFVLMIVSGMVGKSIDLKGISSTLRTFTVFSVSFLMTGVVALIHFQNIVAKSADSLGSRAVRFASSSLVPIVGNMLNDGIKTVSESLKAVQHITGVAGVAAILSG